MVNTQSDGSFAAVWYPDVTGNYLVKATSRSNIKHEGSKQNRQLSINS